MSQLHKLFKCKAQMLGILLIMVCSSAWAQHTVTGKILSATNKEPLIGATVLVKGTANGATTDANGKYTIKVENPADAVLVVSYLSFLPQEMAVQGRQNIDVELTEDVRQLDEVVVIGYGTVKKKDLTGSVTSVRASDIASVKAPNPLEALQGKASGIDMARSSGQAGASISINLRGNRSITAANDPLILVDGIEYGSTLDINPSDIESIEVLKDVSSTAIYGTRGANGVIIITTKKGGQGKTKITFSSYVSYNKPTNIPHFMNSQEYVQKRLETLIADKEYSNYIKQGVSYSSTAGTVTWNSTQYPTPWSVFGTVTLDQLLSASGYTDGYQLLTTDPTALQLLKDGVSIDYLDMIFKNSYSENYELGASGGDDKTSFNFSLGLMNDRGLLRNDKMRRYNFKLGGEHKLFKNVKIGANVLFTNKKHQKRDGGIFTQALKTGTIATLYQDDGTYQQLPDKEFTRNQFNPMLDEVDGAYSNQIRTNRLFGTAYLNWEIIKNLNFKTNFGLDLNSSRNGMYQGPTCLRRISVGTAYTQVQNMAYWGYTWENTLNYKKTFDKHEIEVLLGNSVIENNRETYQMTGIGQQNAGTGFYDWNNFTSVTSTSADTTRQTLSYFGRLNYKFKEKYLFTASLRADGSSVLAAGKKWGYFPSAALGWRIKEENFLKNIDWFTNLKIRVSWGKSGNAAVLPYQTLNQLGNTLAYYTFDNAVYSVNAPFKMGNKNLSWETTETWDVGLDFSFFNRINGSVDFYLANTENLLLNQDLPLDYGYPQVLTNIGATRNKGVEIYLNTVNAKTKDFEWSSDFNFSVNRDKVVSLTNGTSQYTMTDASGRPRIYRIGSPVNCYYDYEKSGIYQIPDLQAEYEYVQKQQGDGQAIDRGKIPMISNKFMPGDAKITDVNGDGVFNDNDKVLYNQSPKFTFGFNNNFTYKNLTLSVAMYGRVGQKLFYSFYGNYKTADLVVENGPYVDAWTSTNTGAKFPRYYTSGNAKQYSSTLAYLDGSFVKIRDITLSYVLPKKLLSKVHVSNMKLYATGKNLFTFSGIDNYDPEVGGSMNFPLAKQYIVGLNLEF